MLLGRYKHTIDAKNRIFIPAKFRDELQDKFIISRDIADNCLNIYPLPQWEIFEKKINELSGIKMRGIKQFVYSNAYEAEPDTMGRVIINQQLCDDVGLKKDVMIIGVSAYAQIWDYAEWETLNGRLNSLKANEDMMRELIDIGF